MEASSPAALPISWRWAALLGFALFAPVTLPAGGGDRRLPEVRRREAGDPLLPAAVRSLRAAPERQAPALTRLAADEPMRVLRHWRTAGGERWVQVEVAPHQGAAGGRRGWLPA